MIKISKICLHENSIFIKIFKIFKIHEHFFMKSVNFFCFVLQCSQREHVHNWNRRYILCCLFWVFVCLFLSNKRQNGWTDLAQILCGTSRDPREGLLMIKICVKKFFSAKFWKCVKNYIVIRKLVCFCFRLYKEKIITSHN